MKNIKRESGITLIALIITIVILIILAGITLTIGMNVILNNSKNSVNTYKNEINNEVSVLDEAYIYLRELTGTGEIVYEVTDEIIPEFITEMNLNDSGVKDKSKDYGITFVNYDSNIQSEVYAPTQYIEMLAGETINIEIEDDYRLYIYACADNNEDNKGTMDIVNENEQIISYSLLNRKFQGAEPLIVDLKAGKYEISTTYKTMLFKIQLIPIVIHEEGENKGESTEDTNQEISWYANKTIPDWISITTNNGTRTGDTPFTDTSITTAIKVKDGFSINLGDENYNIELYITGGSAERTLTLDEDATFSQTLQKRSVTDQSPITLEGKTGTLNFKVSGESQLYAIILTKVE